MEKIIIVGAVGGGATAAGQLRFYNKDAVIKILIGILSCLMPPAARLM